MGRDLATWALVAHPEAPDAGLTIACTVTRPDAATLQFRFDLTGDVASLLWPEPADTGARTDGLWTTTCLEAFLAAGDGRYIELNFAPSGDWAAYRFDGYRSGMRPALDVAAPTIRTESTDGVRSLCVTLHLPADDLDRVAALALSAVIARQSGGKSWWALAHAPGKPDFHHRACFIASLPAPDRL